MEENELQMQSTGSNIPAKAVNMQEIELDTKIKAAHKKGMLQGMLLCAIILAITFVIYGSVKLITLISNGTLYASTLGSLGGSIVDSDVIEKSDTLYRLIEQNYLEEVDKEALQEGIYRGLVDALDDKYSVYYTKKEFEDIIDGYEGSFEGIGAYLSQNVDTMEITVVKPIKNSPAEKAGLMAGDILVNVDGEDITGQELDLVVTKLRGTAGTTVEVGVYRGEEKDVKTFTITRDRVESVSVDYEMKEDNIGYIIISEFTDTTPSQFKEAVDELKGEGMQKLIMDLRSNGGGSVDASVEIADVFVKEGVIVSVKDKRGLVKKYEDSGSEDYLDIPMVVLVDGNTASASEILTGAIKDYGLATIIGTTTFGKGITQNLIELSDGSGVKITSEKYYLPSGNNIHEIGIEPDIEVKWDYEKYKEEKTDNQLEAALNYLKYGNVEGRQED